mmetsp:Transcript_66566/g.210699  ORF Transcript_66566/g.210699 Transcript_66566/m.210699 type:complete len:360 (+) Transcript_66566:1238-2317(+)
MRETGNHHNDHLLQGVAEDPEGERHHELAREVDELPVEVVVVVAAVEETELGGGGELELLGVMLAVRAAARLPAPRAAAGRQRANRALGLGRAALAPLGIRRVGALEGHALPLRRGAFVGDGEAGGPRLPGPPRHPRGVRGRAVPAFAPPVQQDVHRLGRGLPAVLRAREIHPLSSHAVAALADHEDRVPALARVHVNPVDRASAAQGPVARAPRPLCIVEPPSEPLEGFGERDEVRNREPVIDALSHFRPPGGTIKVAARLCLCGEALEPSAQHCASEGDLGGIILVEGESAAPPGRLPFRGHGYEVRAQRLAVEPPILNHAVGGVRGDLKAAVPLGEAGEQRGGGLDPRPLGEALDR